jgi:hypothetical protein
MQSSIEGFAAMFLSMNPQGIVEYIREPQEGDEDSQEDSVMREGLYLAVRIHPYIAQAICPAMATSNNSRLILLFLELAYDLWRVDPPMLLALLLQLKQRADQETQHQMNRELSAYRQGRERFMSAEFEYFLLNYGF